MFLAVFAGRFWNRHETAIHHIVPLRPPLKVDLNVLILQAFGSKDEPHFLDKRALKVTVETQVFRVGRRHQVPTVQYVQGFEALCLF